jgi:Cu+-exporting ATPase
MVNSDYESTQFFETSAMLITFVFLGKYFEAVARRKTSAAIEALLDLQPATATVLLPASCESASPGALPSGADPQRVATVISIELLELGDLVSVMPGSRVPCDGEVVDGRSHADESTVTGESRPIAKQAGDSVFGGSVNETGHLTVRATAVGTDSTLAQIVRLVEDAQCSKAPIQHFADRVSAVFVPTVVAIALLALVVWLAIGYTILPDSWRPSGASPFLLAFTFFITTLVIACPCALGLAAPTAVMVGTGVGARLGVLIKGGAAIEAASRVTAVVFDKTGTLTMGWPCVTDFFPTGTGQLPFELIQRLLAASEEQSEHPYARAIRTHCATVCTPDSIEPCTDFAALPGLGVSCTVGDARVWVGNRALMASIGTCPLLTRTIVLLSFLILLVWVREMLT